MIHHQLSGKINRLINRMGRKKVGRAVDVDDGMFREVTCNASGNGLISILNEVELVAW